MQEIAKNQIETTIQVYLLSPPRMFSEYNGEKENVKNYYGRQLLEMLQNADDAASEAVGEKKVLIRLSGNLLTIANTGYPFSKAGLNSIFHSHLSPKEAKENQIGNKGLGFRAILSWANKVTIKSHDLLVAFSQEYSKKVLSVLLADKKFTKQFKELNIKKYKAPISTLVCPDIESAEVIPFSGMEHYDTIIQIELHDKAIEEVKKQVQQDLDEEVLLFLNHLQKIEIDINGELIVFNKAVISTEKIKIERYFNGNALSKFWNINTLSGHFEDIDRSYQLSLAWQDNLEENKEVIYAYFRTKVPIKCKGILHGSFELNADRNLIIDDDEDHYNRKLVAFLPDLIAKTVERIARNELNQVNYKPLSFSLINLQSLNNLFNVNDFENEIKTSIKSKKIFPTIKNDYINWNDDDKPVYYEELVFPKYLSPTRFHDLLLYCDIKDTENFIKSLDPAAYKIEGIIEDVAQKKDQLSIDEYASLIFAIYNHVEQGSEITSMALFYDKAKNLLSFNKPIFLPNTSTKYDLPTNLGIQIINSQLVEKLIEITNSKSANSLLLNFERFKIKEYKFTEVLEILINHYTSVNSTIADIIELNQHLFNIYHSENNPGVKWTGTAIPLIDKKGSKKLAKELYFGKEYGNFFIEEIYGYNKGKIVASQKKFKSQEITENEWKRYLEWLGVESLPRKITVTGEREYADYNMKNYDFKHKIDDYYFKNGYKEFLEILTNGYSRIVVTSIDDFENILKENSSEKIIRLIDRDEYFRQNLEKDTEPESSFISIWFYNAKSSRSVYGNRMKSYLKWKMGNSAWLNTESNLKSQPTKCCTAAYINEDFKELVDKPLLDYDELKRYNINRDKADYLLNVVGVHKTLNSFPVNMLYSILLKLPEIDPLGKKAKTIYNQLAANYTEKLLDKLDKTDPIYLQFHGKGKVYCKNGAYYPIKEAYYVNDRRYGETVIKQFNTIEIDRRRGKEMIKKLFGVEPLDKIELNITGTPVYHRLNSLFESEMEAFKPYVYVLRKEQDGGDEKNVIKDVKFGLVTSVKLELVKEDISQTISLNDYEYYYLKKRNTVYLKVPEYLAEMQDLKDDIFVCSAIAESFSAILDVDSQRQQIRELFSKPNNGRDELLRSELDDFNLQKLNEARRILGVTNNPKLEFWKSFSRCFKGKKNVLVSESDHELLEHLKSTFPLFNEIISLVFAEINYQEINEEISSEWIVKLFQRTGITIDKFNKFHYPSINIKELYEIDFKRSIDRNRGIFKSFYHEKCSPSSVLREKFLNNLHEYNTIQPRIVNEITFNVDDDLFEQVKTKFGIEISGKVQTVNIDDIYLDNLESLWQLSQTLITDRRLFDQFIGEDVIAQSLLYFPGQLGIIEDRLNSWLGKSPVNNSGEPSSTKSKRIAFGDKTLLYENFSDLKGQLETILDDVGLKGISSSIIRTKSTEVHAVDKPPSGHSGSPGKPKVPKEEVGFVGEYLVYRFLLENIDAKESVKWVSEYARECGVNLNGKDGFGYDIEYIPNGAKHPRYVEVKVVGREDAFHISSSEVKSGERYKKNYELFLIRNLGTPAEARIERIQGLFDYKGKGQSFNNNDMFSVINDKFIIVFNKVD